MAYPWRGSMKILVTGAAGFLGANVVRHLLNQGFDVTTFDKADHTIEGARTVVGDLLDPASVKGAAEGQDAIVHIGAIGDVYLAGEQPALASSVNVVGSAQIAEAAKEAGARVVYASTWEVYGKPVADVITEEHPCEPDHPYNITKLAGERILLAADHLNDVPTVALRLGTAYGPGLRSNSVFRLFIDKARRKEPITIQGDGSQFRQFTHSDDIAEAFSLACQSELHGEVMNIVAPEPVSIKQLAEVVVARYPTEIQFTEARLGDVPPAVVSSEKAGRLLGWKPGVTFEDGMGRLMDLTPTQ
jgi:UDP-glucose 4-epimerase